MDEPIVIVGAGLAGARAAAALREAHYPGRIVLIGEETHLPYDRPPLSKDVLKGASPDTAVTLFAPDYYATHRIELMLGQRVVDVRRATKHVALADGRAVAYAHLILATGLRSRPLRGFALGEHLFHLRTLDDAQRLRDALRRRPRAIVIGGGLLGLEVAATARQMGCDVCVIERHPTLLYQSVAPVVGDYVMALHRRQGVRILTGVTPRNLALATAADVPQLGTGNRAGDSARSEVLAELSNDEVLHADIVVAATGSIINTELAEACGLEVDDGIIVDPFGRTSDPSIYAVGDVARYFNALLGRTIRVESWHNAQNQSAAVAQVVAGLRRPYAEVPWFWSDQFDMNLQIIGYSSDWDRVIVRGNAKGPRFTVLYLEGNRLVAANTVNNGRDIRAAREYIAARTPLEFDRLARADTPFDYAMLSASAPADLVG
jgi:NADPH-dependent 2,4-dienoyl-CoA reductase/sulfur reductase-like enzyme